VDCSKEIQLTREEYSKNHPGGKIGISTKTIEKMVDNANDLIMKYDSELTKGCIEERLERNSYGAVVVMVNNKDFRIFTDGDLKRMYSCAVFEYYDKNKPMTIDVGSNEYQALKLMIDNKISTLVVTKNDEYYGLIKLSKIIERNI
jgi:signal-transduction protein with cAMP-binding, CBS, and nucleotidyltransferase domain